MEITLPAHAKINWTLDALGRYPSGSALEGFTKIETIFCKIGLHDLVTVRVTPNSKTGEITIECNNEDVPQGSNNQAEKNVCFKAIQVLRNHHPEIKPYSIHVFIDKRIPLSGGLGGSSTDGSSVLSALNTLLELNLSPKELKELASEFGSDTAFFVSNSNIALGEGRGEKLTYLPDMPCSMHVLLLNPKIELFVGDVYRHLPDNTFPKNTSKTSSLLCMEALQKGSQIETLCGFISNDLEKSDFVIRRFPELSKIKSELIKAGALAASMSGSGSTIFGIFADEHSMKDAGNNLVTKFPKYHFFMTEILLS